MIFSSIAVKAILFYLLSSINNNVRITPFTALEAVFVIEIINEVYKEDEDRDNRNYGKD